MTNLSDERAQTFSRAFAKLGKVTISFVMLVRLSVRPHRTTRLALDEFSWHLILGDFSKSVDKIQDSLKSDENNGYLTCRTIYIFDYISLSSA